MNKETGKLSLVATPIGNLDDMSIRAIRTLKEADLIAAEDTRHSRILLDHYDIDVPMTSYHEHNKYEKAEILIEKMLSGMNIALVTDAGTPAISDPGEVLVKMAKERGIHVTSVPGPSALITALSMSGFPARSFCFEGFLPQDKSEKEIVLKRLQNEERTVIFYEAPHRLKKTLGEFANVIGNRPIALCRELTKVHEEARVTTIEEALKTFESEEPRGEYVLIIEGRNHEDAEKELADKWKEMPLKEHLDMYIKQGLDKKQAMKAVAADLGISKRDVYQQLLEEE